MAATRPVRVAAATSKKPGGMTLYAIERRKLRRSSSPAPSPGLWLRLRLRLPPASAGGGEKIELVYRIFLLIFCCHFNPVSWRSSRQTR